MDGPQRCDEAGKATLDESAAEKSLAIINIKMMSILSLIAN